jgi:CDP-glycerol glycerophosphotransferase (TagB/SpsB family)
VLRVADAVVTDESEEAVDFLLTGRRLLHWLPGKAGADDSPLAACYRPDEYLPGPVTRTFDELLVALDTAFEPIGPDEQDAYRRAVRLAFAHTDDRNAWRLAWRLRGHT